MSDRQKGIMINWGVVIFMAGQIFFAGGAYYRLNSIADSQIASDKKRDVMVELINELQKSNVRIQEQIHALEVRLAAKNIVGDITPRLNVAGEKWSVRK